MQDMKRMLARNISRHRKERGYTQEELARKLGITFQAVSKWENGTSMPDIALLPALSRVLGISVDGLLGYVSQQEKVSIYEDEYRIADYYWGIEPNHMCYQVLQLMPPTRPLKLLDIGCGEGRDAVFFARNGYDVTAFDISEAGIEKTSKLAEQAGVHVNVFKANVLDYRLDSPFDILYSSGVLHYIRSEYRRDIFANYKAYTNHDGIHAFNVFVEKPFIDPPPEHEPNAYTWHSGELMGYYHDWYFLHSTEVVFDCHSSGIPHQHAMTEIVAQKRIRT